MEPSDAQLVARVLASGDERAFEHLVMRHQTRLRNWLRQMTGDQDTADDIVQEAFIRAWHRMSSIKQPSKFGSWLMSVAYRRFLQHERSRRTASRKHAEAMPAETMADPSGQIDASMDLVRMLATLGTAQRAAMVLCYAHGMSYSEVAEVLGLPLATVKSHIARSKAKIRSSVGRVAAG